jgi:hypothetical protein
LPFGVNLMDPTKVDGLVHLATELSPRLVVLDTLARCIVGGDENTAKDIGVAVEAAERLRRASRGCVLLVHHSGKDQAAGARGSSALRGAVATEIECSHVDGLTTLKQTKQRDHEIDEPMRLGLVPVGESCALVPYRAQDQELPAGAIKMLSELEDIATDEGVSSKVWMVSSAVAERSFYRWQKGLLDHGYCQKAGAKAQARYTVTDLGRQVLHS